VTDGEDARLQRLEAVVHGRVQGVGFRYHVRRRAEALGVTGWVANEPDGTVRCVAEGDRQTLERLLADVRRGPTGARVERVVTGWHAATGGFEGFRVRSRGHTGD
jgi:acylphosphatase